MKERFSDLQIKLSAIKAFKNKGKPLKQIALLTVMPEGENIGGASGNRWG
jgi:hypothetical protein